MQKRNIIPKSLKFWHKEMSLVWTQTFPDCDKMLCQWADDSRVLEQRQRMLSRHKSSSYNKHEINVERVTTEVNAE